MTVLTPSEERSAHAGQRLVVGSLWMIGLRWSVRLTGLISTIVLARLLTPRDFGIVAMAMLVVGALEVFSETGQRLALIRHPDPTRAHYDSAWTMSLLIGLVLAVASFLLAPVAELYFDEPRIIIVIQCLGLRAFLAGFENIGIVILRRELRFDRLFQFAIWQKAISFVVTLSLAFLLMNYWALVGGILAGQVASLVLSYIMQPYRPRLNVSKVREIWSYSIWALIKHIGLYLNSRADEVAVGGGFSGDAGTVAMGHYTVAADLATAPTKELIDPISAALFPVMATVQHDAQKLSDLYQRVLGWSAVICASTSIGVAVVANDLVEVVLGPRWQAVAPLIAWLALSGGLLGVASSVYSALDVIGKPQLSARLQWNRLLLLCVAVFPVAFILQDLILVAMARFAVTVVMTPLMFVVLCKVLEIPLRRIWAAVWRPFLAGAGMAAAVSYGSSALEALAYGRLGLDVAIGAVVFFALLYLLWFLAGRPEGVEREALDLIHARLDRWRRGTAIEDKIAAGVRRSIEASAAAPRPGSGELVILLYLAIPASLERLAVKMSLVAALKQRIRRTLQVLSWLLLRRHNIDYGAWLVVENTNKGDSAIREAIKEQLQSTFSERRLRFRELQWGHLDAEEGAAINAGCDLFVIGGSGYFHLDRGGLLPRRIGDDLQVLRTIKCSKVAYGIGINQFLYAPVEEPDTNLSIAGESRKIIMEVLAELDGISVRDEQTRETLAALTDRKVWMTGDPALFLVGNRDVRRAGPERRPARLRVGLNFAVHGSGTSARTSLMWPVYLQFLRALAREYPVDFEYVQHSDTERCLALLLRLHGIWIRWNDPLPGDLPGCYETLDFHICQMLHSSILSLNAGTPTLNFGYDTKNFAFFEMMGLHDFCLPSAGRDVAKLLATARNAIERADEYRAIVAARKAQLRSTTELFLAEVAKTMSADSAVRQEQPDFHGGDGPRR